MAQVGDSAHTSYGSGTVTEVDTVRGRSTFRVAGRGFDVWVDETKLRVASEPDLELMAGLEATIDPGGGRVNDDNSTTLPWDGSPQYPVDMFSKEQTIQPGDHQIDADKRLHPSNSLTKNQSGSNRESPGPATHLFAYYDAYDQGEPRPEPHHNHEDEDEDDDHRESRELQRALSAASEFTDGPEHPDWGDDPWHEGLPEVERTFGKDSAYRPAGLSDRYASFELEATTDPEITAWRADPVGYIEMRGYLLSDDSERLDYKYADYSNLLDADHTMRTAAWKDVRTKAMRLRHEGRVHVNDASEGRIYATIEGDHGTYETLIVKGGSMGGFGGGQSITNWHCGCEWGRWAFKRRFSYVGRLCSHGYAAYLEMQSKDIGPGHFKNKKKYNPGAKKFHGAVVDKYKSWLTDNSQTPEAASIADFVHTSAENIGEDDVAKLYDYVHANPEEVPERKFDVDYGNDPEKAYKQADVLHTRPQGLTPNLREVPEGEGEQWQDVTKDERETTGPDQIVHFSAVMRQLHGVGEATPVQNDVMNALSSATASPGSPIVDQITASLHQAGPEDPEYTEENVGGHTRRTRNPSYLSPGASGAPAPTYEDPPENVGGHTRNPGGNPNRLVEGPANRINTPTTPTGGTPVPGAPKPPTPAIDVSKNSPAPPGAPPGAPGAPPLGAPSGAPGGAAPGAPGSPAGGGAPTPPPPPGGGGNGGWKENPDTSAIAGDKYKVTEGDTLSGIAKRWGLGDDRNTNYQDLAKNNPSITNPDLITPGMELTRQTGPNVPALPTAPAPPAPGAGAPPAEHGPPPGAPPGPAPAPGPIPGPGINAAPGLNSPANTNPALNNPLAPPKTSSYRYAETSTPALLDKLREMSSHPASDSLGTMDSRNDDLRGVVDELQDRGVDASFMVASLGHLASDPSDGNPDFAGTSQPGWADEAFEGSGPAPKGYFSDSASYVDEFERPDFVDITDAPDGDIIKFNDSRSKPQQGPRKAYLQTLADLHHGGPATVGDLSSPGVGSVMDEQPAGGFGAPGGGMGGLPEGPGAGGFRSPTQQSVASRYAEVAPPSGYFNPENPDAEDWELGGGEPFLDDLRHHLPSGGGGGGGMIPGLGGGAQGGEAAAGGEGAAAGGELAEMAPELLAVAAFDRGEFGDLSGVSRAGSGPRQSVRIDPGARQGLVRPPQHQAAIEDFGNDGVPEMADYADSGATDIVASFQRSAAGSAVMSAGGGGGGSDDDIASRAQAFLRTAGRKYSPEEQRELEAEFHPQGARNTPTDEDLANTHYLL